ncbi:4-alpha-glucanotransferase [Roseofilum reptotaenium CS-1145]|uniref:4-alpha-glucanotransferase n=1 Tax=Roseofilum reptotaenium AO1-A TaxID=1925591 RepID=A0A1L9QTN9_9CYAN|nr:4-alpha-glucanotransferase [Roseofilum reptotaenium]MDB9518950.1 4-alpha-glucanotransferase [Roseofilum reptotaenium CS-1145]OJJ25957.1 4-alpha-glucanotransferase [Roseofilum reptotaenium AO1-A]
MAFERASGILLHPTSLPSSFGIGDLGENAYRFIDFLARSGQKIWQILPLGPTGYEHSPYTMNYSAFAGNPLMISLEQLATEGLLNSEELIPLNGEDILPNRVNFDRVIPHKYGFLKQAYETFKEQLAEEENPALTNFTQFCQEQASWLDDYVLFMSLMEENGGQAWNHWERSLARREPQSLARKKETLVDSILYHQFLQFKFFEQWRNLRQYTNEKGIQIIGDVSIYVCHNSADVWANPEIFKLDPQTLEPAWMAGVPPDYFSATGQLWGNPVYDWNKLQETNYAWWIERFRATLQYVDVVRIDHFRGFEAYWQVPAGEETAMNGEWVKAPGFEFFQTLGEELGSLPVLAEDLGIITPEVEELRDHFNFPGMKILLFAFGGGSDNAYLPHNYPQNSICYTGTHDNDTAVGWWEKASQKEKQHLAEYLGYSSPEEITEISWLLIRIALSAVAVWAILPLQDLFSLDNQGRMNDPSVSAGNWRWRYADPGMLSQELGDRLLHLTQSYGR